MCLYKKQKTENTDANMLTDVIQKRWGFWVGFTFNNNN